MTNETVKEMARLEVDIATMEDERTPLQSTLDKSQTQVTIGLLGLLLGIVLLIAGFWGLGLLLTLAGLLAWLNNAGKRNTTKSRLAEIEEQLPAKRQRLAELKIEHGSQ